MASQMSLHKDDDDIERFLSSVRICNEYAQYLDGIFKQLSFELAFLIPHRRLTRVKRSEIDNVDEDFDVAVIVKFQHHSIILPPSSNQFDFIQRSLEEGVRDRRARKKRNQPDAIEPNHHPENFMYNSQGSQLIGVAKVFFQETNPDNEIECILTSAIISRRGKQAGALKLYIKMIPCDSDDDNDLIQLTFRILEAFDLPAHLCFNIHVHPFLGLSRFPIIHNGSESEQQHHDIPSMIKFDHEKKAFRVTFTPSKESNSVLMFKVFGNLKPDPRQSSDAPIIHDVIAVPQMDWHNLTEAHFYLASKWYNHCHWFKLMIGVEQNLTQDDDFTPSSCVKKEGYILTQVDYKHDIRLHIKMMQFHGPFLGLTSVKRVRIKHVQRIESDHESSEPSQSETAIQILKRAFENYKRETKPRIEALAQHVSHLTAVERQIKSEWNEMIACHAAIDDPKPFSGLPGTLPESMHDDKFESIPIVQVMPTDKSSLFFKAAFDEFSRPHHEQGHDGIDADIILQQFNYSPGYEKTIECYCQLPATKFFNGLPLFLSDKSHIQVTFQIEFAIADSEFQLKLERTFHFELHHDFSTSKRRSRKESGLSDASPQGSYIHVVTDLPPFHHDIMPPDPTVDPAILTLRQELSDSLNHLDQLETIDRHQHNEIMTQVTSIPTSELHHRVNSSSFNDEDAVSIEDIRLSTTPAPRIPSRSSISSQDNVSIGSTIDQTSTTRSSSSLSRSEGVKFDEGPACGSVPFSLSEDPPWSSRDMMSISTSNASQAPSSLQDSKKSSPIPSSRPSRESFSSSSCAPSGSRPGSKKRNSTVSSKSSSRASSTTSSRSGSVRSRTASIKRQSRTGSSKRQSRAESTEQTDTSQPPLQEQKYTKEDYKTMKNQPRGKVPIGSEVVVKSTKPTDEDRPGVLKFYGHTNSNDGVWCGIEFEAAVGKNDGTRHGKRYFKSKEGHGSFVRPHRVFCPDGSPAFHFLPN